MKKFLLLICTLVVIPFAAFSATDPLDVYYSGKLCFDASKTTDSYSSCFALTGKKQDVKIEIDDGKTFEVHAGLNLTGMIETDTSDIVGNLVRINKTSDNDTIFQFELDQVSAPLKAAQTAQVLGTQRLEGVVKIAKDKNEMSAALELFELCESGLEQKCTDSNINVDSDVPIRGKVFISAHINPN